MREREKEIAFKFSQFDARENGHKISFDRIIGGS